MNVASVTENYTKRIQGRMNHMCTLTVLPSLYCFCLLTVRGVIEDFFLENFESRAIVIARCLTGLYEGMTVNVFPNKKQ